MKTTKTPTLQMGSLEQAFPVYAISPQGDGKIPQTIQMGGRPSDHVLTYPVKQMG